MSSVWVVTEGDYEDNHIAGIFSKEEKAYEYYNLHSKRNGPKCHFHLPVEYKLDVPIEPKLCMINIDYIDNEWKYSVADNSDSWIFSDCGTVCEHNSNSYTAIVSYNSDESVMINNAQNYFLKYLAENKI